KYLLLVEYRADRIVEFDSRSKAAPDRLLDHDPCRRRYQSLCMEVAGDVAEEPRRHGQVKDADCIAVTDRCPQGFETASFSGVGRNVGQAGDEPVDLRGIDIVAVDVLGDRVPREGLEIRIRQAGARRPD